MRHSTNFTHYNLLFLLLFGSLIFPGLGECRELGPSGRGLVGQLRVCGREFRKGGKG